MALFSQHRRVTPLQLLLHHTFGLHTIRWNKPLSHSSLPLSSASAVVFFVSEILKNVSSLRGDLPHAPGNMSSISTPGVGQPIPLRRFLPPSWPASQLRGHLDSHLRDSPSTIAVSPNTRWTLWQCYRLFVFPILVLSVRSFPSSATSPTLFSTLPQRRTLKSSNNM